MNCVLPIFIAVLLPVCCGCGWGGGSDSVNSLDQSTTLDVSPTATTFIDITERVQFTARHVVPHPERYELPDIMGAGCALLDFDRDGLLDLFFVSVTDETHAVPTDLLWRQVESGRFENTPLVKDELATGVGMGVSAGDLNNDGWLDLYVSCYGEDRLLLNVPAGDGRARTFRDVTSSAGLSNLRWGTSVCCVDYDRDGWLDLFVTNYVDYVPQECLQVSGVNRDFCGPHRFGSTSDRLFRNITGEQPVQDDPVVSTVVFQDASIEAGISASEGAGLGVAAADFTRDGWPDLYVANDQQPNFLWVNQQDGSFQEQALLLGCACDALGNSQASMGIAVHDFDGDERFDILLTHLDGERNTLYLNTPAGGFRDSSSTWGPSQHSLPLTGFGVACVEPATAANGAVDVIVANGRVRRPDGATSDVDDIWAPYGQPDCLYRISDHQVAGSRIQEQAVWSLPGSASTVSRGLAIGDLDGDGDQDAVITCLADQPRIFENTGNRSVDSGLLVVRTIEPALGDRDALGAVVTLVTDSRRAVRLVQTAGSYLCASEAVVRFGFRSDDLPRELLVQWPDGSNEQFPVSDVDQIQRLEHGRSRSTD